MGMLGLWRVRLVLGVALAFCIGGIAASQASAHSVGLARVKVADSGGVSLAVAHRLSLSAPSLGPVVVKAGGRGGHTPAATPRGRLDGTLSTATSRTFIQARGVRTTQIFAAPVNYRDASGHWAAIDNTLVPTSGGFRTRANSTQVDLPASLGDGPVTFRDRGAWVSFMLQGASATGSASGVTDSFTNALPGTTVRYSAEGNALKEALVLKDASAPSRFVFSVTLSPGLRLAQHAGAVDVVDSTGRTRFALGRPFMYAAGATGDHHEVTVDLKGSGTSWSLTLVPDRAWVRRELAHGPVVVDPTVTPNGSGVTQDCSLDGTPANQNTSFCASTLASVGWDGSNDHRALMGFTIPSWLPRDSTILNARLGLYLGAESTTTAKSVGLYRVTRPWTQSATWNRYDGTNAWTSAGADYDATHNAVVNPRWAARRAGITGTRR